MHDHELLRRAQYDQDNGPPDNLYVIPAAHVPSASPRAVNNFPTFSRRLRTIRHPKDYRPAIKNYDGRSGPSIWLKMYSIAALASRGTTPVARPSPSRVHHLLANTVSPFHDQLPGNL
jgi:hypothetical protein